MPVWQVSNLWQLTVNMQKSIASCAQRFAIGAPLNVANTIMNIVKNVQSPVENAPTNVVKWQLNYLIFKYIIL
jgi:hypothetical protein